MTEVSVYLTPDEVEAVLTLEGMNQLLGWGKRIKIILDHDDIDAALSDFPHLVYLSASSGHSNKDLSCVFDALGSDANRKKIAVTLSDGITECYVEIEKWDHANEKAWLFVKIPNVDPDLDPVLWLYYDRTHADNDAYVGDPSDAVVHNVWDDDFVLVSHMQDDPDTSSIRDSTQFANDGVKAAAGEPTEIEDAAFIGDAQDFDGDGDFVDVAHAAELAIPDNFTVECLFKRTGNLVVGDGIVTKGIGTVWNRNYYLETNANANFSIDFANGVAVLLRVNGTTAITLNQRFYLAGVLDDDFLRLYVDGAEDQVPTARTINPFTGVNNLNIGRLSPNSSAARYINGIIDEVRISKTDRSAAWIKATKESLWDHLNNFGVEQLLQPISLVEIPVVLA